LKTYIFVNDLFNKNLSNDTEFHHRHVSVSDYAALFSILSKNDNIQLFLLANSGLKFSKATLYLLKFSRKKFYRALKQLKDGGLIRKSEGGNYVHTIYGKVVYKKSILGLAKYTRYLKEMKMMEALMQTSNFTNEDVGGIFEKLTGVHLPIDADKESIRESGIEFIWTLEDLESMLLSRIELCRNQILIATRLNNERIINSIIHKSKLGIEVKILADRGLVSNYFELHNDNRGLNDKNAVERSRTVGNPWYPNDKGINRRITGIPFGMIILDGKEVGMELVNRRNPTKFNFGILIKSVNGCKVMKDYYQRFWDAATPA
jgi:hypothetical protein